MAAGARFEFVQEQFDLMCADLARFSIARAVAVSAAVPVLMSPIMLSNRAGRCGYPAAAAEQGPQARRLTSRQFHYASKLRSYLGAQARPYIYLLDGGLADNQGLRSPLETVLMHEDAWQLVQRLGIADVRKVAFIVVNASTGLDPRWSLAPSIPRIGQVLRSRTFRSTATRLRPRNCWPPASTAGGRTSRPSATPRATTLLPQASAP